MLHRGLFKCVRVTEEMIERRVASESKEPRYAMCNTWRYDFEEVDDGAAAYRGGMASLYLNRPNQFAVNESYYLEFSSVG